MNPGSAQYGSVADTRARALTDATQQAYLASGAESRAAQEAYNQAATRQRYQMGMDSAQFNNQLGRRSSRRVALGTSRSTRSRR